MELRTRAYVLMAVAVGAVAAVAINAQARWSRFGGGPGPGVFYGAPFKYNSQYPTKYVRSDVWANTWADNDAIYAVNDDSYGWQDVAPTSNLQVSTLSAPDTTMTGTNVNVMAEFGTLGQKGTDNATWKANGIISVSGTLYVSASRQVYGNTAAPWIQTAANAQIIKSPAPNHGAAGSWTPLPPTGQPYTTPMFSGTVNSVPAFIQYGKDYVGNTADNSNLYVYAVSNEGCWNNCSKLFLGRVLITDLPLLDATKWSYYQGGDGMVSGNWGAWATAAPLLNSALHVGGLSQIQYVPGFQGGSYFYINWYYPTPLGPSPPMAESSVWEFYTAPKPWGPYTQLGPPKIWNSDPGMGLYSPNIISKSVAVAGKQATMNIATAGSYNHQEQDGRPAGQGTYTLTIVPLTVRSP
jgi:hypothetical protein